MLTDATFEEPSSLVHVVDDDDSFRTSLSRMLIAAGFEVKGYGCAGEFLLAEGATSPGCVLLDISMPGPSGIDLLQALVSRDAAPPVIFLTGRDDVLTTVDVMKRGALDYIVKPASAERILPTVRMALQIDATRRAARCELNELRSRFATLTPAERAIFHGIVCSKLNKQLAAELGACERTIKTLRARMLRKMNTKTLQRLVRAAKILEDADDVDAITSNTRHVPLQLRSSALHPALGTHGVHVGRHALDADDAATALAAAEGSRAGELSGTEPER